MPCTLITEQGKLETDQDVAEGFRKFFASVYRQDKGMPAPELYIKVTGSMPDVVVTPEEVLETINQLDPTKAAGHDDLHPALLKSVAVYIAAPLSELYNQSLTLGQLPLDWKSARVTPIHKSGDKMSPTNYRPISLTSVLCKVLERILRKRICEYLLKANLINPQQHGFLPQRSCLTNLLCFLDEISDRLDRGDPVEVLYLDFMKAFDSVNHRLLIHKLKAYGIAQSVCEWIENFLEQRTFYVSVRNASSTASDVCSGVPQGSVLGPLLFLLYINEVTEGVSSPCWLFADDIKVVIDANARDVTERDLSSLSKWAEKWDLPFNPRKCQHLTMRDADAPLVIRDESGEVHSIKRCCVVKDLGVTMSADFKPAQQCAAAANKARRALFQLRAAITCKDPDIFVPLYCAFVRPHLEYCVQAWAPFLQKDIATLEKVQRLATRMVKGTKGMTYPQRLQLCGLFSLERRRLRGDLVEAFKITHDLSCESLRGMLTASSLTNTRGHDFKLRKDRARLDLRKFGFRHRVVNHWNRLPAEVVGAVSVDHFKRELDGAWDKVFPDLL